MLTTEDFDFELPEELIAQTPLSDRSSSRLLVVDRETGKFEDKHFYNIIDELAPGDALVMNDTRVLPARIYGEKQETGAHLEILLLNNIEGDTWETLIKPAKRAKVGTKITFGDGRLEAVVEEELDHGGRIIRFQYKGIFLEILESLGEMPLPLSNGLCQRKRLSCCTDCRLAFYPRIAGADRSKRRQAGLSDFARWFRNVSSSQCR